MESITTELKHCLNNASLLNSSGGMIFGKVCALR